MSLGVFLPLQFLEETQKDRFQSSLLMVIQQLVAILVFS